ncbi:YppE family protein [Psychrobacillus vulpis]|uniref:YppE family protein n=1 Tax=Psychrobacillus vulpis TaxID=2325572 RepID=UPI001F118592|nr:YppE family protein [Psychrobacillus vulpis]
MSLADLSKQLLGECDDCIIRFESYREEDKDPDFFQEVRPHAYYIDELLLEWENLVRKWIQVKRPKYVHPSQINSLVESMKQFIVQSYYKGTSKKRFYKSIHSSKYTLETIIQAIKEVGDEHA